MVFYKHSIYKIVSSVFYIIVGIVLIFTNVLIPASNSSKRILGIVILAYGIFRAVTSYTAAKKNNDKHTSN